MWSPGARLAGRSHAQIVERAGNALAALLHHVGGDHGRGHSGVAEQLVDRAPIRPALQQMGRTRMAQGMGTDGCGQSGTPHGHCEGFVDDTGGDMMAAGDAGTGGNGHGMGEKDVLPAPCRGGLGRRARQGMRQVHRPMALRQILVRQGVDPGQMLLEGGCAWRERWCSDLYPPSPHGRSQLLHRAIDVCDAQSDGC